MTAIKEIHYESHGTYGSPRITRDLEKINIQCSRQRVARLMRVMGIRAKCARKFKVTTDSNHKEPIAPNLLGQKTSLPICRSRSGQVISPTCGRSGGWQYLTVIMELFNREIIGYSLSKESLDRTNSQRRSGYGGTASAATKGSHYAFRPRGAVCQQIIQGKAIKIRYDSKHERERKLLRQRCHGIILQDHEIRLDLWQEISE